MDENRFRTKTEQIKYFKQLAYEYHIDAHRSTERNDYLLGKSDAYEMAAFELEHNME